MRLWSLHPKYLDSRGLTALWRETLLARSVLAGTTRGYRYHPQLIRFREHSDPLAAINAYLQAVYEEGTNRGFRFEASKLAQADTGASPAAKIPVTTGQLAYELAFLKAKLLHRNPAWLAAFESLEIPEPHPLFETVTGPAAHWERVRQAFIPG